MTIAMGLAANTREHVIGVGTTMVSRWRVAATACPPNLSAWKWAILRHHINIHAGTLASTTVGVGNRVVIVAVIAMAVGRIVCVVA